MKHIGLGINLFETYLNLNGKKTDVKLTLIICFIILETDLHQIEQLSLSRGLFDWFEDRIPKDGNGIYTCFIVS